MAHTPAPSPRRPGQPNRPVQASASAPGPSGSGGLATALKLVAFAAFIGGAGWFGYGEYKKRQVAETPVVEAPKPKRETVPEPERVPDVAPVVKPVVPVKEVVETKKEPEPVVEKKAALPAIPSLERGDALPALKDSTRARIADGRWADHIASVRAAAIAAVKSRNRGDGPAMLEKRGEKGGLPLGLAQILIFDRIGEKGLATFATEQPAFATRLLTTPDMAELFSDYVAPEDSVPDALRIWARLDSVDPAEKDKLAHRNLALALALIHDKPGADEHASEVFAYYLKAEKEHKLYYDSAKIPPDELVWAVADASFPLPEYDWALKNLKYPLGKLADAYGSVPYRSKHDPYGEFTMAAVLRIGGVCHQRAQYTEANARARGVPCVYIHDTGGIHAWIAYKTARGWLTEFGGGGGNFGCGIGGIFSTGNPQTKLPVREWDLHLYDDKGRRNGDFEQAKRLLLAAGLDLPAEDKMDLYAAAAQRDPGNPESWRPWIDALVDDKNERSLSFWQNLVTDFRSHMKATPDYYEMSDRIESAKVFPKMSPDAVGEMLRNRRRQFLRTYQNRYDLVAISVRREAEHYLAVKDKARFKSCYLTALRDYVKQLPAYIIVVGDFGELAKDQPEIAKEGLVVIDKTFAKEIYKNLSVDGGHLGLNLRAKVASKIAEVCDACGDTAHAERYREFAKLLKEKADEQAALGH